MTDANIIITTLVESILIFINFVQALFFLCKYPKSSQSIKSMVINIPRMPKMIAGGDPPQSVVQTPPPQ
ncbi:MAG: hypothetical protein A2128_02560 [Candidatus Liptonbacteria bacterium GWC1_60_9]|uniref:Uncharacterized protein n=1 Tax=Candidatus Liptonbacteria bacterium GWC1_60_9 TaxID=1798645 RepID=A0A1G2C4U2_9BACT|nr:MAG: hypothetical protein A2128_02560 [Candidatus Liptonbacteria bacterium GWC1_60_9]